MQLRRIGYGLLLAVCVPVCASAQTWPAKPVRMLVPFAPGGGVDFAARIVGKYLSEQLGQPIVIDNRAGANGIIALEALKNAAPDGYTIAAASNGPLVINPSMYLKLPYDSLRDFAPIGRMVNFPLLLVLPEFPTIAESGVPGYEAFSWAGLIAPAGTPRDVVVRLNRELVQVLQQKDIVEQLAKDGTIPVTDTPPAALIFASGSDEPYLP